MIKCDRNEIGIHDCKPSKVAAVECLGMFYIIKLCTYIDSSIVQIFSIGTKIIPVPALLNFIPIPDLEKWNGDFTFLELELNHIISKVMIPELELEM